MATPADRRLLELLDKWLKSLELHLSYVSLDDERYATIQPWPKHQRPSRWIIDLARQKALALQSQLNERVDQGDVTFSDALELMAFLSNLLAAEHIARFIPLANAEAERAAPIVPEVLPASREEGTGTREMPGLSLNAQPASLARAARPAAETQAKPKSMPAPTRPAPSSTQNQVKPAAQTARAVPAERTQGKPAAPARSTASGKASANAAGAAKPAKAGGPSAGEGASAGRDLFSPTVRAQVIADAARLVQWGRKWYELAELIAGMAGRPSVTDVRRILKDNKTVIDEKAGRG